MPSTISKKQSIAPFILIAAGVVLILAAALLILRQNDSPSSARAAVGARLVDFNLPDLAGKPTRLADYAGKPVLINIWATWCPPCQAEMPLLNSYYQSHKASGFTLLAINAGESSQQAGVFASQLALTFPILLDTSQSVTDRLGAHSLPMSIMVGRDGIVKAIRFGGFTSQTLETDVTPYLNQ